MKAVMLRSSADYKYQIRNHGKGNRHFISRSSENVHGGFLNNALPFSVSYSSFPPSVPLLNPPQHRHQQPPLLPLPIPRSSYPNNRKVNTTKSETLSLKKQNPSITTPKKGDSMRQSVKVSPDSVIIASINRLGPDPKELPKDVSRVWSSPPSGISNNLTNDLVAKFSGSVMSTVLSPPPSSLPLPTFSLRPKLSCNDGIDAGATDSLRRILRLR